MAIRIRRNRGLCSLCLAIRLRRGTWRMEWREFLWEKEESVELFFFLRVMDLFLVSNERLTFIQKELLVKSRIVFLEIRIWKESESAIELSRCVLISVPWWHTVQVFTKSHFLGWYPLCNATGHDFENNTFLQFTVLLLQQVIKDQFHSPRAANVCLETPTHISMLQGDLERIKGYEMWFYQWFQPFSLMQKLLEYLICFKPLRRLLFYFLGNLRL